MIKEKLFEFVTDGPSNPITDEWQKKDRKASAIINLNNKNAQIVHVKRLSIAKETWKAPKSIHERSNLSSLHRKLYGDKRPENGNILNHISNILKITDKVCSIGENISDSHIYALFLCSLPAIYNTLIAVLDMRRENEFISDFIKSKSIDEYNRRLENSEQADNSAKVK